MKNQKIAVLAIDPQYDFHDVPNEFKPVSHYDSDLKPVYIEPSLSVPGSWNDSLRLSSFLYKFQLKISNIFITLDSHHQYHIAHPMYWVDQEGNNPDVFTTIKVSDIKSRKWVPANKDMLSHAIKYAEHLKANNKYELTIWPYHAIVGSVGHSIVSPVLESVKSWERSSLSRYIPVLKGSNPDTEHYGGLEAEFPISSDSETLLNFELLNDLDSHDMIIISGQALSHCVAGTVSQIVDNLPSGDCSKLVILIDTSSPVSGFEKESDIFISEMKRKGVNVVSTADFYIGDNDNLYFK